MFQLLFASLEHLDRVSDDIFSRIKDRVREGCCASAPCCAMDLDCAHYKDTHCVQVTMETERVRCIDDRVARAKTKVESLSGNNGNAIQVYASSKYPVPNGTLASLCAALNHFFACCVCQ